MESFLDGVHEANLGGICNYRRGSQCIDADKSTIAICWGVEDAARVGKKRGLKLTKKECQRVLEMCCRHMMQR
jgi:hypothetical protein